MKHSLCEYEAEAAKPQAVDIIRNLLRYIIKAKRCISFRNLAAGEDSRACRLRASSTRSARRMRTGFRTPAAWGARADEGVAPPENEKSIPKGCFVLWGELTKKMTNYFAFK